MHKKNRENIQPLGHFSRLYVYRKNMRLKIGRISNNKGRVCVFILLQDHFSDFAYMT